MKGGMSHRSGVYESIIGLVSMSHRSDACVERETDILITVILKSYSVVACPTV